MSVTVSIRPISWKALNDSKAKFNWDQGAHLDITPIGKPVANPTGDTEFRVNLAVQSGKFSKTPKKGPLCWHGERKFFERLFTDHPSLIISQKGTFQASNYLARLESLKAKWISKGLWGCTCNGTEPDPPTPPAPAAKKSPKKAKSGSPKPPKAPKVKANPEIVASPIPTAALIGESKTLDHPKADLISMVGGFYALETIGAYTHALASDPRPSAAKFAEQFETFRDDYRVRLGRMLFDYLCLAAWGESRHAQGGGLRVKGVESHRHDSYDQAIEHDPRQFLPALHRLFKDGKWSHSYGGAKWANIVSAAMMFFSMPRTVFIDHVVDLSHNCSLAFDKGMVVQSPNVGIYKAMLDRKRDGSLFDAPTQVPYAVAQLVTRAINLGIIPAKPENVQVGGETWFPTIQWGEKFMSLTYGKKGGSHGKAKQGTPVHGVCDQPTVGTEPALRAA